jgi:hypothetical protein
MLGEKYTRAFVRAVNFTRDTHQDTQRYKSICVDCSRVVATLAKSWSLLLAKGRPTQYEKSGKSVSSEIGTAKLCAERKMAQRKIGAAKT